MLPRPRPSDDEFNSDCDFIVTVANFKGYANEQTVLTEVANYKAKKQHVQS